MSIWTSILITGGSSGLGEALALALARPGVTLALTGRDAARLQAVADACRAKGASVTAQLLDVADTAAMAAFVSACDAAAPLDLVIANAGTSAGTGGGLETPEQARMILDTNLRGVFNTVEPALPLMAARGHGQIALMSSLAGFRGLPGAPSYCASKAAVRVWGEALRADWIAHGLKINVVCPGFVTTRMTARNNFRMPFLMDAARAAQIILAGLMRDTARIVFPWRLYALMRVMAALPDPLLDVLTQRLPRKGAHDAG